MLPTIAPVAPPAPAQPAAPHASPRPAGSHGFATMLQQTQQAQQAHRMERSAVPSENAGNADAPTATTREAKPQGRAADLRSPARGDDPDRAAAPSRPAAGEARKDERDDAERDDATAGAPAAGAGLAHRLPGLAPDSGALGVASRAAGRPSDDAPTNELPGNGGRPGGAVRASLRPPADDASRDARGVDRTPGSAFETTALKTQDLAATRTEERAPATPIDGKSDPASIAPPAFASAAPTPAVAAPLDVTLPTPVDAPEFAQSLGVQVSVLVQDGVQRAELHLNPVEMGPVSVQITVDGTQARVDFGADDAATRRAIEAGLPELASALRDAGMTLQGGGVSQHARNPSEPDQAGDAALGSCAAAAQRDDPASPVAIGRRTVGAGGVDLYA